MIRSSFTPSGVATVWVDMMLLSCVSPQTCLSHIVDQPLNPLTCGRKNSSSSTSPQNQFNCHPHFLSRVLSSLLPTTMFIPTSWCTLSGLGAPSLKWHNSKLWPTNFVHRWRFLEVTCSAYSLSGQRHMLVCGCHRLKQLKTCLQKTLLKFHESSGDLAVLFIFSHEFFLSFFLQSPLAPGGITGRCVISFQH